MARKKKESVPLHIKIDVTVMKRLEAYREEMGQTKTTAVERIITAYLDEHGFRKELNA